MQFTARYSKLFAAILGIGILGWALYSGAKISADQIFFEKVGGQWQATEQTRPILLDIHKDHTYTLSGQTHSWNRERGTLVLEEFDSKTVRLQYTPKESGDQLIEEGGHGMSFVKVAAKKAP